MKFTTLNSTRRSKLALIGMASMVSFVLAQEDGEKETPATEVAPAAPPARDAPKADELPEAVEAPADGIPGLPPSTDTPEPVEPFPVFPLPDAPLGDGTTTSPIPGVLPDNLPESSALAQPKPKKSDIITKRPTDNPFLFTNVDLTGLTLIPDKRRFITESKFDPSSFSHGTGVSFSHLNAKNVPVPAPDVLKSKLEKYIGKPLTFADLEVIVQKTQAHYVENGYPLIHVFIPGQTVSDKVMIAVRVGRITRASVPTPESKKGTGFWAGWKSWLVKPYDLNDLEAEVNKKITAVDDLQPTQLGPILADANQSPWARLNRVQQHPFLNVSGKLKPRTAGTDLNSKQFILGEAEVELIATQEPPLKFFVGYDNALTELLGEDRFYLGSIWYDAFGLGLDHQFAFQAFTASDSSALIGVAGSYQIPWKNVGQNTELFAAYVESDTTISTAGIPTDIGGSSFVFGARHFFDLPPIVEGGEVIPGTLGYDPSNLERPLWSPSKKTRQSFGIFHEVGIGFDFKQTDNTLEFGGATVSDDTAKLTQLVLAYNARQTDSSGETNLTLENFIGLGGDDEQFDNLRTGATSSYYYARLKLEREQDLPAGMLLKGRMIAQYASDNLLQSEQLGFGGYNSVRGYAERGYRADNGILLSAEIYSPPLYPLAHFWGKESLQDELRFLAFVDYGTGNAADEQIATDVSQSLMSAGFGFRYNVGDNFNFRFDWGFPLEDLDSPPFDKNASDSRAHLGLVWTF